jgi:serine/threonine protein kinase
LGAERAHAAAPLPAPRDLKPENILLHKLSDSKTSGYLVKITDFGALGRNTGTRAVGAPVKLL